MSKQFNEYMTAAILHGPENLKVQPVPIPSIGSRDVLIRVEAALTCGTDFKVWKQGYHARMIVPPSVFGHELAGVIVNSGQAVRTQFPVGMRVVAANSAPCNKCFFCLRDRANLCEDLVFNNGAYAQYALIPDRIVQQNLMEIPPHLSFVEAAMVEPLACVLRAIYETGPLPGDTVTVIGCGPIGLMFINVLSQQGIRVIALGKRRSKIQAAERLGAAIAFDVTTLSDPIDAVRKVSDKLLGTDAVIEAVGSTATWQWASQIVRCGGTVNLFGGCPRGSKVEFESAALHYSEITIKSSFHHTPRFIRDALSLLASGQISARMFVTGEAMLAELPRVFHHMKQGNQQLKLAVMP